MKKIVLLILTVLILSCNSNNKKVIEEKKFSKENYSYIGFEINNNRILKNKDNKFLLIQKEKEEILNYDNILFLKSGFLVKREDKYGVVNNNNEVVLPIEYEEIIELKENLFAIRKNNKFALFKDNEKVTDFLYEKIVRIDKNLIYVVKNNYLGIINENGESVISNEYLYLDKFSDNYTIAMLSDKKLNYIDMTEKVLLKNEYDYLFPIKDGRGIVVKNNKFGLVNIENLNEIIAPKMDLIKYIDEDIYVEVIGEDNYLIDKNGKKIVDTSFDFIGDISEGLIPVKKNSKFGYIDKTGKIVIPLIYEEIGEIENNLVIVLDKNTQKYGVINTKNKYVIEPKWSYISARSKNLFIVGNEEGEEFLYNSNEQKIINKTFKKINMLDDNFYIGILEDKVLLIIYLNEKIKQYDISTKEIVSVRKNEILLENNQEYISIMIKEKIK